MRTFNILSKLHDQEKHFKKELSKTILEYLDSLSPSKRLEQMELLLCGHLNHLPTLDRRLTPQEKRCLYLVSIGKEIKEMARILGVSQRTIEYHRSNITKKLKVPNLMAAVGSMQSNTTNYINNQFLIAELPINIFLVDIAGYVCWANKNLLDYVNITSLQEVIGVHISHWDKCRWDAIQEVLRTKQETVAEEFYNENFFSSIRKPVIQNDKLIGVLGVSINITEKKQSEIANYINCSCNRGS